jgi:hypothetical protein
MNWTTPASEDALAATAAALKAHNFEPIVVNTKEEALAKIKELIPAGASVTNGASRTLEQIGFIEYLKSGTHGWNNLHGAIVAEKDPAKQSILRKQATLSDFYLGSVHGLSQTGEMLIASNTGSQMPNIVYSSPNVIFVVGAQKIVPTLADTYKRLWEHVFALEDARMKKLYGSGTAVNKIFVYNNENVAFTGRKIWVVLVKEALGF